jgi:hypothetical protein
MLHLSPPSSRVTLMIRSLCPLAPPGYF